MKSKYIRAICLGAAGLLVISTAAINNHKQSEDVTAKAVATASVIEESAETVDAGVTAGIASVTAQALASDEDVATVSDTDTELTAAAQEEVTSVYGYTNLGIAVVVLVVASVWFAFRRSLEHLSVRCQTMQPVKC